MPFIVLVLYQNNDGPSLHFMKLMVQPFCREWPVHRVCGSLWLKGRVLEPWPSSSPPSQDITCYHRGDERKNGTVGRRVSLGTRLPESQSGLCHILAVILVTLPLYLQFSSLKSRTKDSIYFKGVFLVWNEFYVKHLVSGT